MLCYQASRGRNSCGTCDRTLMQRFAAGFYGTYTVAAAERDWRQKTAYHAIWRCGIMPPDRRASPLFVPTLSGVPSATAAFSFLGGLATHGVRNSGVRADAAETTGGIPRGGGLLRSSSSFA